MKHRPGPKLVHPNSRKTKSICKNLKRLSTRQKSKQAHQMKQNLLGEKILWFQENLPTNDKLTTAQIMELIEKYLHRFDEELEQIVLKQSVGGKRQRQHASREDSIMHTKKHEREEFETCGIELPNLQNAEEVNKLSTWNGELRFLQNFKFVRFSRKNLTNVADKV